ncbi:Uncharacterized protein ToN1_41670 [Aromatoleum petrolei]|nr:Uncharacterized protein ToN1_41670 [Aromatoleum petrolei]
MCGSGHLLDFRVQREGRSDVLTCAMTEVRDDATVARIVLAKEPKVGLDPAG